MNNLARACWLEASYNTQRDYDNQSKRDWLLSLANDAADAIDYILCDGYCRDGEEM